MKAQIKHAAAWTITACIVLLALVFAFFHIGPKYEQQNMLMFTGVKGAVTGITTEDIRVIVIGKKARNCLLTIVKAEVFSNGTWLEARAKLFKKDGTDLALEDQRISVGESFARSVVIKPAGSAVKIAVMGRCHPLWLSKQDFIWLDSTKNPNQVYP